ncbi:unnamed protein product (mitochondrion) [Plasmodiophora brassicae]|uniref:Fucosyltransferase n=1 Tax=Plasmodiophora brassicae TaxID=37360 RepID=A0A0G4IV89_PLABS|nr:hypothetical protein PBRA_001022 [Plasmodiophora brassicae]SPQ97133.1 unnamed protein product [Plasmodiophora brassicae]
MLLPLKSSDRRPSYSVHVLQRVARHRYLLPFTMALSIASFLLIATMSTTDDRQVGTELVFRDPMSPRPPPKPLPIQELNALRGQPVAHPYRPMTAQELGLLTVYIDSGHYLGPGYAHVIDRCPWRDGEFLQCEFSNTPSRRQESHALWVHVPGAPGGIQRTHPNQKLVVMSIESAANYGELDNPNFMGQFDYEMSYRLSATIPCLYSGEWMAGITRPPIPQSKKVDAIAFLNGNCGPASGRQQIMDELIRLPGGYPVHAFGACSHNREFPPELNNDKVALFSTYKFCVAMENTIAQDYVTEKLWQSLTAGCVPVYLGAPNIQDFLPVPSDQIIIDYRALGGVQALNDRLHALSASPSSYDAMLAWKTLPVEATLPGWKFLHAQSIMPDPQCLMCQALALDLEQQCTADPVRFADST